METMTPNEIAEEIWLKYYEWAVKGAPMDKQPSAESELEERVRRLASTAAAHYRDKCEDAVNEIGGFVADMGDVLSREDLMEFLGKLQGTLRRPD